LALDLDLAKAEITTAHDLIDSIIQEKILLSRKIDLINSENMSLRDKNLELEEKLEQLAKENPNIRNSISATLTTQYNEPNTIPHTIIDNSPPETPIQIQQPPEPNPLPPVLQTPEPVKVSTTHNTSAPTSLKRSHKSKTSKHSESMFAKPRSATEVTWKRETSAEMMNKLRKQSQELPEKLSEKLPEKLSEKKKETGFYCLARQ